MQAPQSAEREYSRTSWAYLICEAEIARIAAAKSTAFRFTLARIMASITTIVKMLANMEGMRTAHAVLETFSVTYRMHGYTIAEVNRSRVSSNMCANVPVEVF